MAGTQMNGGFGQCCDGNPPAIESWTFKAGKEKALTLYSYEEAKKYYEKLCKKPPGGSVVLLFRTWINTFMGEMDEHFGFELDLKNKENQLDFHTLINGNDHLIDSSKAFNKVKN